MSRFWLVPLLLAVLVIVPFLIWGDSIEAVVTGAPGIWALNGAAGDGAVVGIVLLIADLVLPIPTTSVIAGLGILYGPWMGTLFSLVGSMSAALIGYLAGRFAGRPLARRWLGEQLSTGERVFSRFGGWIVAASRWMPVLPEVISVSAGVSRMPLPAFLAAAFCGALPHCALFASIGHLGAEMPLWTMAISAVIPILLWLIAHVTGLTRRLGLRPDA